MRFRRSENIAEALAHLGELGENARILAGGTDVMPQYLGGEIGDVTLVHIEELAELKGLSFGERTNVGPLVTHRRLGSDPELRKVHPGLALASRTVGGWQTQSVGTVGGNICNASPAADTAPPLLIADGYVSLEAAEGSRRVALDDFFVDRRKTVTRSDELVTAIDLQPLPANAGETYVKLGRRGAMEVALVGLAVRLGFASDGTVDLARVAVASVAPTPRRVPQAEQVLLGSRLEADSLESAGEALEAQSAPIDDARAPASYRMRVLCGLLGRAAAQCREMVTT